MIPVSRPSLGQAETANVISAVETGWIGPAGEFVSEFETAWSALCGRQHGISVSSGTAALDTAVHALKLPANSEVILPAFTMMSCAAALVRNGLKPMLVDADPETWCMDTTRIEEAITGNTSAIMAVHTYGYPADMTSIADIAGRHRLKVIEDAAEAHGAIHNGKPCGGFGDVSTFSFYANKIITTGEGGMVLCNDDEIAERCRAYRNMYFGAVDRFTHAEIGQSYRLTNLQAAVGCAQVQQIDRILKHKRRIAEIYDGNLAGIPDLQLPPRSDDSENVFWVYGIVPGDSYPAGDELQGQLRENGIDSRRFFQGLHRQPALADLLEDGEFPVTDRLAARGLYLPSGNGTTEDEVRESAVMLKKCLGV